jgi:hypothetical protein
MRKWGVVITVFYTLILLGLIVPAAVFIAGKDSGWLQVREAYRDPVLWILVGAIIVSQALLLFLSVDQSEKRLKPRTHIMVSCLVSGFLTALLTSGVIFCIGCAVWGDKSMPNNFDYVWIIWGVLWLLWGGVFYVYFRNSSVAVSRLTAWLLRGSVLELLIAVPSHVLVRRRDDCSAPVATSFGIASGIAIMLLSFGPGILFLYKKRLDTYSTRVPVIRPNPR